MVRIVDRDSVVLALLLASLWPTPARADAQNKAVAESMYRDALTQMQAGNYQSACPKLAESQRLEPAVGTLLYLGECYERLGLTASAWATFTAAIDAAKRVSNREREQIAVERAARLADKVSHIAIVVPAEVRVPGLEVRRNGSLIGEAAWGVALPVDPGTHTLEVVAPGRQPWTKQVTIDATPRADITETLPPLAELVPVAIVQKPVLDQTPAIERKPVGSPSPPPVLTDTASGARPGSFQRYAGVALGGLGIAAIALGTIFGLEAKAKEQDSEDYCWDNDKTRCSRRGVQLIDDAQTAANVANVGFVGGAIAVISGAALYLTAPKAATDASRSHASRLRIVPEVLPARSTLALEGRF